MKKNEAVLYDDMLPEYDFKGEVRGKVARDYGRNRKLRILDPDLRKTFPDSDAANEAHHTPVRIAATCSAPVPLKRRARTAVAPKSKAQKKVRA